MNRASLFSKKIVIEIGCYDKYNRTEQNNEQSSKTEKGIHFTIFFFLLIMLKKRGLFVSIAAQKTDINSIALDEYIHLKKKKHEDYFEFILRQKKRKHKFFFESILNKTRPSQILLHATAAHQQLHIQ